MESGETRLPWHDLVVTRTKDSYFTSATCQIYNQRAKFSSKDSNRLCCCGRLVRCHSFDGESLHAYANKSHDNKWSPPKIFKPQNHTVSVPVTIFGRLKSDGCKFIRIDDQSDMKVIYDLLVDDCGGKEHRPSLILSVYGGAKYFTMTEKLAKEIIRGIIDAATTAGN